MHMARPTSPSDRAILQGWLRMSTLEQSLALRARILFLLADGLTPKVISEQLQITPPTVFKVAKTLSGGGPRGLERPAT
jgi:DNA-binding NarL/FixJ family response regulator